MQTHERTNATLGEADRTFSRELPELLQEYGSGWVAYHGACRLGVAATKWELYELCLSSGFSRGEFLVRSIEPEEVALTIGQLQTSAPP